MARVEHINLTLFFSLTVLKEEKKICKSFCTDNTELK